jgi:hypothetical protein
MLPGFWVVSTKPGKDAGSADSRSYRCDRGRRLAQRDGGPESGGHCLMGHSRTIAFSDVSTRVVAVALAVALVVSLAIAWLFEISLERALVLAPAAIFGLGLCAGVFVLLGRAAAESIRSARRPRLVLGLILGLVALITLLTLLGVELPREGA